MVYDDCDCGIHPCDLTQDGYACTCLPGYQMLGVSAENETCIDIDECQQPDVCPGARCINRPGTYSCQCLPGYEEPSCIDINECRYAGFCPEESDCTNTEGSYYCTCHHGFHGDDCLDINECQNETLNNCGPDQHCVNSEGSYTCLDCTRYQQKCYVLAYQIATFADAEQTCADYGGILATIPDVGTQLFITQLAGNLDTWIGLDDRLNEGQFMWSDGTALGAGYSNWSPGEPNDLSTTSAQDCVHLWSLAGFRWDDQPCDRMEHFVCQFDM
ncbi:latent-transforming growth factor beta-binding protein 2-like [Branchiostoma floridae]|uniref:Latent-transforming growth factor beta-binding protein 2-like n=1 Tax=Branchiostoma floridae TaxID=7739 RepID=A0A9J7LH94_BRAFL|nr:latent-transforming growth factor beta-binding protein 2-like [Branchiostoma floridae]